MTCGCGDGWARSGIDPLPPFPLRIRYHNKGRGHPRLYRCIYIKNIIDPCLQSSYPLHCLRLMFRRHFPHLLHLRRCSCPRQHCRQRCPLHCLDWGCERSLRLCDTHPCVRANKNTNTRSSASHKHTLKCFKDAQQQTPELIRKCKIRHRYKR